MSTKEDCLKRWYALKDHPVQQDLVHSIENGIRFPVVVAGRRCLAEGTLVSTPSGPVKIEDLKVGDKIIGWDNGPHITTVSKIYDNGIHSVTELLNSGDVYLAGTDEHSLYGTNEWNISRNQINDFRIKIKDITQRQRIYRSYHTDLITGGKKNLKNTYALGAFLSNGCIYSKSSSGLNCSSIQISDGTEDVIKKIANDLNAKSRKCPGNNYSYVIYTDINSIPFYKDWCHKKYSQEKIADWSEIDTWDRETALQFLAGVIDSDGSVYYKSKQEKEAIIEISMQSYSVIDCCRKIIFKYFQEDVTYYVDSRDKYKNGNVHCIKTTSNIQVINILRYLSRYLVKCKIDTGKLVIKNVLKDRIGFKKGRTYSAHTYDITVSNESNLYCLHKGGIVTSNSGKTERFKRFVTKYAMSNPGSKLFIAAPTYNQVKRIYWDDMKLLSMSYCFNKRPSETELVIYFPNGSEINLIGLDRPERIEGVPWDGGGIDEFADVKGDAWVSNIFPALSTVNPLKPGYKPWCWLYGVPDGLNHFYDLAQYAQTSGDPEWKYYHWKSRDILPIEVIEAAKRSMSDKQFKVEFEASFETSTGRIYEDYSNANCTDQLINANEILHWSHDFNFSPLSSCISVIRNDTLYILDEIILESAVARQTAEEFVSKYLNHKNKTVYLYGDPSGRIGEKHGHESDYTEIESILRSNGWNVIRKVQLSHPAIKDRQNVVRKVIKDASGKIKLYVNPTKANYCHRGLMTVSTKPGSTFQEQETQYQHITTAIGYMVYVLCPPQGSYGYASNIKLY